MYWRAVGWGLFLSLSIEPSYLLKHRLLPAGHLDGSQTIATSLRGFLVPPLSKNGSDASNLHSAQDREPIVTAISARTSVSTLVTAVGFPAVVARTLQPQFSE